MPNSYPEFFARVEESFPEEQKNIKMFRADLESYAKVYARLFDHTISRWRAVPGFLPKIPAFLKQSTLSTRDYLDRFFLDERLKAILFQPAVFMGIPMDEFPTVNYIMMFYLLMKNGMYTIKGGGQALTDSLLRKFQLLGGVFHSTQGVRQILVERGRATGVVTEDGARRPARAVLSAISLPGTVNSLIGRSFFKPNYLENLDSLRPSVSVFSLNIGLDCPPEELGIKSHIGMYFPDANIDNCMKRQRSSREMEGYSITAHTNTDPGFKDGKLYPVGIVGGTDPAAWIQLSKLDYLAAKKMFCAQMIDKVERMYPGFKDNCKIYNLATPRTMARYTANPMGAIMGFNCSCGLHRRIIQACDLPIKNVSMAGAWTNRLGGFMQTMKSGILAAEGV